MSAVTERLLEREAELTVLGHAVGRAASGLGALVVIEGPPGVGKTRLLEATRREALDAGMRVLHARATELEAEFAFGVVRQLVEPVVRSSSEEDLATLLAGAASLSELVLGGVPATERRQVPSESEFPALHGLYWLIANLAETTPLALIVDDAHWCDLSSLRVFSFLAPRLAELPVALVAALRPGAEPERGRLIARIASEPVSEKLRPGPLSETATGQLLLARLGTQPDPDFVHACHVAVGGNPLLLDRLTKELLSEDIAPTAANSARVAAIGPRAISQSVLTRLKQLSAAASSVAGVAAVLGDRAELRHLAQLAGLDPHVAAHAADELARVAILAYEGEIRFTHPIVRQAVYADIPPRARALAHSRAAQLFLAEHAPLDRVAAHLLASDGSGDRVVVDTLRDAAREALARAAPQTAVAYLRRAMAEPPAVPERAELLAELGVAEARAGATEAADHLAQALEHTEDRGRRGEIAIELARALVMGGRLPEALECLESESAAQESPHSEVALRLEDELIGWSRIDISRRRQAAERLERIGAVVHGTRPAERAVLANVAIERAVRGASPERTIELALRAVGDGALLADEGPESPVYYLAAWALSVSERPELADEALERALEEARRRGSALGFTIASCFRSNVAFRMGSIPDAEANARSVLDVDPEHRWGLGLPLAVGYLLDALIERGDPKAATEALAESGLPEDIPDFTLFIALLFARGKLRVLQGSTEAGLADLLECGERAKAWGSRNPAFIPWRSHAALSLLAMGEASRGKALVDEELGLARAAGATRAVGIALRTAGLLEGAGAGVQLLREAVAVLAPLTAPLEHARALVDLGAALRRANRRSEARPPLRAGLDAAQRCGAGALVERAHVELQATGARPRGLLLTGVDALTASERRVARMASEGMTNREIAQALFVTRKTVETHLSRAFQKLDIDARAQLGSALNEPTATVRS